MELLNAPQCLFCTHLDWKNKRAITCDAFPEGIPDEIFDNEVSHKKPYPGDNGIVFEAKEGKK